VEIFVLVLFAFWWLFVAALCAFACDNPSSGSFVLKLVPQEGCRVEGMRRRARWPSSRWTSDCRCACVSSNLDIAPIRDANFLQERSG
jgi:hypothetical protein